MNLEWEVSYALCVICCMTRSNPITLKTTIIAHINISQKINKSVSLIKFEFTKFASSFCLTTLVAHSFSSWELNPSWHLQRRGFLVRYEKLINSRTLDNSRHFLNTRFVEQHVDLKQFGPTLSWVLENISSFANRSQWTQTRNLFRAHLKIFESNKKLSDLTFGPSSRIDRIRLNIY